MESTWDPAGSNNDDLAGFALDELDGGLQSLYPGQLLPPTQPILYPVLAPPLHPLLHAEASGSSTTFSPPPGTSSLSASSLSQSPVTRELSREQIPLLSWRRNTKQSLEVLCPRCNAWIRTGSKLRQTTQPLEAHMQGRRCNPSAILEAQAHTETQHAREAMLPIPAGPSPVYHVPGSLSDIAPLSEQAAMVQPMPSDSESPALPLFSFDLSTPADYTDEYTTDSDYDTQSDAESPATPRVVCALPQRSSTRTAHVSLQPHPSPAGGDAPHSAATQTPDPCASEPYAVDPALLSLWEGDFANVPHSCPGIALNWPHEDFFQSYPFQRHDLSIPGFLGYRFCAVNSDGVSFRIRSVQCSGSLTVSEDAACPECLSLTDGVEHLGHMAREARPHTIYKYRSHAQLCDVAKHLKQKLSL
ncbi:uncharacterized protein B0H18DRAFT_1121592 [Fomitopsis serialis]|uniref:uncharacterized protein n=1 Tax=Fomitopsis serialis TaxID=139415 RepID=UPI0020085419|nr:uncharacterized protein B0H18DRAFT_1121592 [Neoantrodia serialis]KAH9921016.1 hypothetical protein B0H18DRAFT_1121592 [Neoantrodia serialis]